jgi:hypothetical protein
MGGRLERDPGGFKYMSKSDTQKKSADDFEQAFLTVTKLANALLSNRHHYVESGTYQEAEARTDFIDKFFIALGWDVGHDHQRDPYRQEVKIEKTIQQRHQAAKPTMPSR